MKKSQSEEREELNVVYSYLKILTLTGGLAITSLIIVGHSLITIIRDNQPHPMAAKQFIPAFEIPPATELPTAESPKPETVITDNQTVTKPLEEVTTLEMPGQQEEIPQFSEPGSADSEQLNPAFSELEPVISEVVTPAQIDVFPAGYGTFRILIESNATDHFTATLTDILHQEIVAEAYEVVPGKNEFLLDSGEIPRGDYVLMVSNGIITSQKRVTLK